MVQSGRCSNDGQLRVRCSNEGRLKSPRESYVLFCFLIFSLHHSTPASTCSVEQTHLSFGRRQSRMFYGLGILPVTALMWFTSKTVRGNEKSHSFPPLQHSDMIHSGLYTASRRGLKKKKKNYKNLSWCIDIRGGETLSADCSGSVRFLMPDLNVKTAAGKIGGSSLHFKLKMTGSGSPPGPSLEQELSTVFCRRKHYQTCWRSK